MFIRIPKCLLLAVCLAASPASAAPDKYIVLFGQSSPSPTEAVSYFLPKHMGFFEQENLDVTLQPTQGGAQLFQLLDQGLADSGVAAIPGELLVREQGLKIKAIFNVIRKHGTKLAVVDDGTINDPADLKGKTVGVNSLGSSRALDGRAMILAAGLDPDKDVTWLPIGFGPQAAHALASGQVQALTLWDSAYVAIENQGVKLKYYTFPFQDALMGFVNIASEKKLTEERDKLLRYQRAYAKASYMRTLNPRVAACAYIVETNRQNAPDAKKQFNDTLRQVSQDGGNSELEPGVTLLGSFVPGKWEKNRDHYLEIGVVKKGFPAEDYYVTDLRWYEEINAFDRAEIEQLARDYKGCADL